jgi:hypothetical protein
LIVVHSLFPELSNSGSPPAEPGVYLKEIILRSDPNFVSKTL